MFMTYVLSKIRIKNQIDKLINEEVDFLKRVFEEDQDYEYEKSSVPFYLWSLVLGSPCP